MRALKGIVRPFNQLDASSALTVRRVLERHLAALRELASDPKCGPVIIAALNVASPNSVISVGGEPVLIDWGMLPVAVAGDEQARARHFAATLGPFVGDLPLPPLSRAGAGMAAPSPSLVPPPARAPSRRGLAIGAAVVVAVALAAGFWVVPKLWTTAPMQVASTAPPQVSGPQPAPPEQPLPVQAASKEEIVCALDPACAKPPARTTPVRQDSETRQPVPAPLLSIDLYVNFPYNSAELTAEARVTLDRLGTALRDQRLGGFGFMIAGHTDAKGSDDYNLSLSERRAEAVRQYMIAQFGISPERLSAKGYGKSRPLDPTRPEDGVNRRVQVVNTTASGGPQ